MQRTPCLGETLAVRARKGTNMRAQAGGGHGHGYSRPQMGPPTTAFFYHTSMWQLRVVLRQAWLGLEETGQLGPDCLQPSSDCPLQLKSLGNWLVLTFLAASPGPRERGGEAVAHRPQQPEPSSHPCTASTLLCNNDLGSYLVMKPDSQAMPREEWPEARALDEA